MDTMERRDFLKTVATGLGITTLSYIGVATLASTEPVVKFYESKSGDQMKDKILIAYASRCGTTGEIAKAMADTLQAAGKSVDVRLAKHVTSLADYKLVMIGSAVRAAQWLPEAVEFVKETRLILRRVATAYFTVCLTMAEDNDSSRRAAAKYVEPLYEYHHADLEGFFGGCLDYKRMSWLDRTIMKAHGGRAQGDYRNWNAIQAWSQDVYHRLVA